jgi:hypothetical protein
MSMSMKAAGATIAQVASEARELEGHVVDTAMVLVHTAF